MGAGEQAWEEGAVASRQSLGKWKGKGASLHFHGVQRSQHDGASREGGGQRKSGQGGRGRGGKAASKDRPVYPSAAACWEINSLQFGD